jgi:hypothetical protein
VDATPDSNCPYSTSPQSTSRHSIVMDPTGVLPSRVRPAVALSGRWSVTHPSTDGRDVAGDGSGPGLSDGVEQLLLDYEHLQRRLETMPVIEQAEGILMGRFGIDPDTAFQLLRRWSSHTNHKLRDISGLLVAAAAQPAADPTDGPQRQRTPTALDHLISRLNTSVHPGQHASQHDKDHP